MEKSYFHLYFIGLSLLGADLYERNRFFKSWLKRMTLGNISSDFDSRKVAGLQ